MRSNPVWRTLGWLFAVLVAATVARGFVLDTDPSGIYVVKWQASPIRMEVKLHGDLNPLSGSPRPVVLYAMQKWNAELGAVRFQGEGMAPGPYASGNGISEIVMDSTVGGEAFPAGTLAITMSHRRSNDRSESDIVFNSAYKWASYSGGLRNGVMDLERVALHELGHVLGLEHPDENGQGILALMNSQISYVDALQWDDIQGGRALYAAPGYVPPNDNFADAVRIDLTDGVTQLSGSNITATRETGEPGHGESTGLHSVWWHWTAVETGEMTIDTLGSNFDTALAVYTGDSPAALTPIAANDDEETPEQNETPSRKRTSKVVFPVTGGVKYRIAVDGWGDADDVPSGFTGSVTLNLSYKRPPTVTSGQTASDVGWPFSYQIMASRGPTTFEATGLPPGLALDASTGIISGRPQATGVFEVMLAASNAYGTGSGMLSLNVRRGLPALAPSWEGPRVVESGGATTLAVEIPDGLGEITYEWRHNGRTIFGADARILTLENLTPAEAGRYVVSATNDVGTTYAVAWVQVAPVRTQVVPLGISDAPPADLVDAIEVEVGGSIAVALKPDGTVVRWGRGVSSSVVANDVARVSGGRGGLVIRRDGTLAAIGDFGALPAGLRNVVAVAYDGSIGVALRSDARLVTWSRQSGELSETEHTGVVDVSGASNFFVGLKADGSVFTWLSSPYGSPKAIPSWVRDVVAIACSASHTQAVTASGDVIGWTAFGDEVPEIPATLPVVRALSAGRTHGIGLTESGGVVSWGRSIRSLTDIPYGVGNVLQVAGGDGAAFLLRDATNDGLPQITTSPQSRTVAEWGAATFTVEAVANGSVMTYQWRKSGVPIEGATSPSLELSLLRLNDVGSYDVVITNHLGSVTSAPATLSINPLPVVSAVSARHHVLVPGQSFTLAVAASGSGPLSYQWSHNGIDVPGANAAEFSVADVKRADGGYYVAEVTDDYGTRHFPMFVTVAPARSSIRGWGTDFEGELVDIPFELDDIVAVSGGVGGALALRRGGQVVSWGGPTRLQLDKLGEVVALSCTPEMQAVLRSDGTVIAADYAGRYTPFPVSDIVAISGAHRGLLALRSNGTVLAWNPAGDAQSRVPRGLLDVVAISEAISQSTALKSDGSVVAWGLGTSPPAEGVSRIAANSEYILTLDQQGRIKVWAKDGSMATDEMMAPTDIDGVVAIAATDSGGIALRGNGTAVAWGRAEVPVPAVLAGAWAVTGGDNVGFALVEPPASTDHTGIYFGRFSGGSGSGGWAAKIEADGSGFFIGHTYGRSGVVAVPLTVAADGTLEAVGTAETLSGGSGPRALSEDPAGGRRVRNLTPFTLSGLIVDGFMTGELTGLDARFSGAKSVGDEFSGVGYYAGTAPGSTTTAVHAIVGPDRQAMIVASGAERSGAAGGVLDMNGVFVPSKTDFGMFAFSIRENATGLAGTLTPRGTAEPVAFTAVSDSVESTTRLIAISTRSRAGSGDRTLIMGFVVAGGAEKQLVVRGVGPTLVPLGVTEALRDPQLLLYRNGGVALDQNDNWGGSPAMLQTFARLGMSPALAADSKDAALVRTIGSGLYTAHVSSPTVDSGIALVEVYDGDVEPDGSRFTALATRTVAGPGENTLIAGIVLAGNGPKNLLIRGVGPSLVSQGVSASSVLQDPRLAVFSGNTVIAQNDDWGGTTQLKNAFGEVGLGSFQPDTSKDAALLVTLDPGVYTVHLSGANEGSGVALIEVYEMR